MNTAPSPRQLSDAVKADWDRIVAEQPERTRNLERWVLVRNIAGGVAAVTFLLTLVVFFAGIVLQAFLAVLAGIFLAATTVPVVVISGIVWAIALIRVDAIRKLERERMFTLYAIRVDERVNPPVYTVTVPGGWLHPDLTATRELLSA